jgi:hypothetical protein
VKPRSSRQSILQKLGSQAYPPGLDVAGIGVLAFAASAAMELLLGIPEPSAHDEFSYLLAADTFIHGRLTNPTHPMWVHFETMHVIHQPSYMSKYMPAQGLFLALGRVLGGHPIVGVWLGMAFMCAAICWMLQAWLPRRWALLGGLFAIIHPNFGVGNYWAQSYWGGAVSAGGGALLLGGVRYLMDQPRKSYAVATGVGLAILANTRAYEGLVLSLPVGLGLLIWLFGRHRPSLDVTMHRVLLPLAIVGVITVSGMAYYNYRITGSALQIPYLLHEKTYSVSTLFLWQQLPPKPIFRHKIIEDFHTGYELPYHFQKHSPEGFVKINFAALMMYLLVAGSVFAIPLIGSARRLLSWSWGSRWGRFALFVYVFFILGIMFETYLSPHYLAPITALNYFFVLQGIRLWRLRDPRVGRIVAIAVPLLAVTVMAIILYQTVAAHDDFAPALQRARLLKQLNQGKDRHLVLVTYGPNHSYHKEWVYNEADIDGSKVVWARDMGLKENCKLIEYFKDRKVWSLEIDHDEAPIKLNHFSEQSCHEVVS